VEAVHDRGTPSVAGRAHPVRFPSMLTWSDDTNTLDTAGYFQKIKLVHKFFFEAHLVHKSWLASLGKWSELGRCH
jgi:hypothetical protein